MGEPVRLEQTFPSPYGVARLPTRAGRLTYSGRGGAFRCRAVQRPDAPTLRTTWPTRAATADSIPRGHRLLEKLLARRSREREANPRGGG